MSHLNPDKLYVRYIGNIDKREEAFPRRYTLTHSDLTGDLFLSIGSSYHFDQISGFYTRLMRDEVLASWEGETTKELHVHCHVSGGLVVGSGFWRDAIFRRHLPQVLQGLRYGDRELYELHPELDQANVFVHFHARQPGLNRVEDWGKLQDYVI